MRCQFLLLSQLKLGHPLCKSQHNCRNILLSDHPRAIVFYSVIQQFYQLFNI
jgi:hypothetical protein